MGKITLEFIEHNKVLFKCSYPTSRERLWKAISTAEELDQWFMKTEMDFRKGGKYSFEGGWDGWIEDFDAFEFIQFNSSAESFTKFSLHPTEHGIELHLADQITMDLEAPAQESIHNIQPGGKGTHWVGLLAGWHDFLLALGNHIAHEEIEDHFDQLGLKYKALLEEKHQ